MKELQVTAKGKHKEKCKRIVSFRITSFPRRTTARSVRSIEKTLEKANKNRQQEQEQSPCNRSYISTRQLPAVKKLPNMNKKASQEGRSFKSQTNTPLHKRQRIKNRLNNLENEHNKNKCENARKCNPSPRRKKSKNELQTLNEITHFSQSLTT